MTERVVRVTIENIAPENGAFFSSTWVAIQNGEFDIFDQGDAASGTFLEGLAEDASTDGITTAFSDSDATGVQQTILGPTGNFNDFDSGDSVSTQFVVEHEVDRFFSYAAMILPSNDAFIANGDPVEIFDEAGELIPGIEIIVTGDRVWDAGTEVNDEIPENTAALAQAAPNTGDDENGTVLLHPGFIGSAREDSAEQGNILQARPAGDFTTENDGADYEIARFTFSFVDDILGTGVGERLNGTDQADIINGRGGDDIVNGLGGNDQVIGGKGNDLIRGGEGDDILEGRTGFDRLLGGAGDDMLKGGAGNDRLNGGAGNDTLMGGSKSDLFIFNTNEAFDTDDVGVDTITDFNTDDDFILLDRDTFAAITSVSSSKASPGFSVSTEFTVVDTNAEANTSEALIVHSLESGNLYYNPDGATAGFGNGGLFANVTPELEGDNFILR
ncbi:spondin domain-containing protein [Dapis sp. BLCC M126]|uniref:spondin domain-containing protein n=1 Tax=Dapis sp. BLCC M126 TaxID=3400189 RepID=UPI003CF60359